MVLSKHLNELVNEVYSILKKLKLFLVQNTLGYFNFRVLLFSDTLIVAKRHAYAW